MLWPCVAGQALSVLAAVALISGGAIRMQDGFAVDAAIPVPNYMIAGTIMPKGAYSSAVTALQSANSSNADALMARAEASLHEGSAPTRSISDLKMALSHSPGSARAWTILSEALMPSEKAEAARALSMALTLGPFDFWLVERRASNSAILWNQLGADARPAALDQARLLWHDPILHPQLLQLLSSKAGAALVTRAFSGDRDSLRKLNRFVSAEERRLAPDPGPN